MFDADLMESWTLEDKIRAFSRPLNCGLNDHDSVEYEEPVSAYAEPNLEDAWKCSEGWE